MPVVKTVEPAAEPLTLAEVKAHCRVDVTDDDAYLTALIVAVRQTAEQELLRTLITSTYKLVLPEFPSALIDLPYPVLQSVSTVKYFDTNGTQQTLSSALYRIDTASLPGAVKVIDTWPDTQERQDAVEITYTAGYLNAAAVPQAIKQWMLMRIGSMYDTRADFSTGRGVVTVNMPFAGSLLDPYRVWSL